MSEIKFRPLGDRVLVDPDPVDDVNPGGLIIVPDSAKEKPKTGTVVAMGSGAFNKDGVRIPMNDIQIGQRILFSKFAGYEHKIGEKEYKLVGLQDILGIIEE